MAYVVWLLARVDQLEDLINKASSRPSVPPPRLPPPLPKTEALIYEQELSPEVQARRLRGPDTGAKGGSTIAILDEEPADDKIDLTSDEVSRIVKTVLREIRK